jgi:HTH-type transcriptional regulator/antitoxin HigA
VGDAHSNLPNLLRKRTGKMTLGTPSTNPYIELLTSFPPRPITSEEELIATKKVIDSLIDKGELTLHEQDYLNVLGTLVHEYEENINLYLIFMV